MIQTRQNDAQLAKPAPLLQDASRDLPEEANVAWVTPAGWVYLSPLQALPACSEFELHRRLPEMLTVIQYKDHMYVDAEVLARLAPEQKGRLDRITDRVLTTYWEDYGDAE